MATPCISRGCRGALSNGAESWAWRSLVKSMCKAHLSISRWGLTGRRPHFKDRHEVVTETGSDHWSRAGRLPTNLIRSSNTEPAARPHHGIHDWKSRTLRRLTYAYVGGLVIVTGRLVGFPRANPLCRDPAGAGRSRIRPCAGGPGCQSPSSSSGSGGTARMGRGCLTNQITNDLRRFARLIGSKIRPVAGASSARSPHGSPGAGAWNAPA